MIPVLDKGFVNIRASSCAGDILNNIQTEYNRGIFNKKLLEIPTLVLSVKCPLFVQIFLSDKGISTFTKKGIQDIDAYVPTISEIGAKDLTTCQDIQADIERTTAALLINTKAYKEDTCDAFVAQIVAPISVYNEVIAYGNLSQWIEIVSCKGLPKPVEEYRKAIYSAMLAEWPNINELIRLHGK